MQPGRYDITIYRGSTFSISVTRASAAGVPVDFDISYINVPTDDDGDCRMYIRPGWKTRPDKTKLPPLLTLNLTNSRISISGQTITLTISAADTEDLTFDEGMYDLEIATGDAVPVVHKVLYGRVTVKDEQTVL